MIPRTLHQVWLTDAPIKAPELRQTFLQHNPDWSLILWTEKNLASSSLPSEVIDIVLDQTLCYVVRGDLLRYAVLAEYGGVYSDMDVRFQKPFDDLLNTQGFSSESYMGELGNAVIGCVRGYEPCIECRNAVADAITAHHDDCNRDPVKYSGVGFHAQFLKKFETIHPAHYFQPFSWDDVETGRDKGWPESYAVHLWHGIDDDGWTKRRF
jgi:hypothetical protein